MPPADTDGIDATDFCSLGIVFPIADQNAFFLWNFGKLLQGIGEHFPFFIADAIRICTRLKIKILTDIEKAKNLLTENKDKLDMLSDILYEKENITGKEFLDLLGIEPEKPETEAETKHEAEVETEAVVETKSEDENE